MAEQPRPVTKEQVPDTAATYERADPKRESGAGRLTTNDKATPTPTPDKMQNAVHHAQDGTKQLNAEDEASLTPKPEDAAMSKEPLGWEKKP